MGEHLRIGGEIGLGASITTVGLRAVDRLDIPYIAGGDCFDSIFSGRSVIELADVVFPNNQMFPVLSIIRNFDAILDSIVVVYLVVGFIAARHRRSNVQRVVRIVGG